MSSRRKNTIRLKGFHGRLALRLGIVGFAVAGLFGLITWLDQGNRVINAEIQLGGEASWEQGQ